MDSRTREPAPSPDAADFIRFCYRRRRVGWPELYDEMCAVAGRGLYRGWGTDELRAEGIGFSLFEMPTLAGMVGRVVAEEQERRQAARRLAAEAAGSAERAPADGTGDPAAEAAPSIRFRRTPVVA